MRKTLFLTLILFSSNLYAQIRTGSLIGVNIAERSIYSENDTIPVVINLGDTKIQDKASWYLNGQPINEQVAQTINPNKIEEVKVEKDFIDSNTANRKGKIYIRTKEDYNPKLISLNELKAKYLNLADMAPTLFMLDEKIINRDYDEFKVDENYILKIEVQSVENSKEKLAINVIRLITRTEENVKKGQYHLAQRK